MKNKLIILVILSLLPYIQSYSQNWNINCASSINKWEIHNFSKTISNSTTYMCIGIPSSIAIYSIIKKDDINLEKAIYIGTTILEAASINYITKHLINEKRPFLKHPNKIEFYGSSSDHDPSFPSGHTASAFALATSLSISYPKWYIITPSALWSCGVGIARINQGVHYPSDVIAGAAIGIGCGIANVYINRLLNKVIFKGKKE